MARQSVWTHLLEDPAVGGAESWSNGDYLIVEQIGKVHVTYIVSRRGEVVGHFAGLVSAKAKVAKMRGKDDS